MKMAKKYYSEYELIDLMKDAKKASVLIEGRITKNSDLTVKNGQYGQFVAFGINVQNQTSSLKYVGDALGAQLNTYTKDENSWDTVNVMCNDKPKNKFEYLTGQNLQPGDTVVMLGVLKPNEFNGNTTLQLSNAKLYKVKYRANGNDFKGNPINTDATVATNDSVPNPAFNNEVDDDADSPF